MKTFFKSVVVYVLSTLLLSSAVGAQEKSGSKKADSKLPNPTEVRLNVMVLDSGSRYVNDIKPEEIKIFEDGIEQKLTYFAKKDPIVRLALVVDNSGSLRTLFPIVLSVAATLVTNLGAKDEVVVMRFVSSDKIEVLEDWTADKPKAIKAIQLMYVEGGQSAVIDAVYLAGEKTKARLASEKSNRYAVVLMSDREDRDSYYKLDQVLNSFKGTDIQIFPFALTSQLSTQGPFFDGGNAKAKAQELATTLGFRTGGNAYVLDDKITKELLLENLRSLVLELRSQYVVGYATAMNPRKAPRKLSVEIVGETNGQKRQGFIRDSLRVPKD